MSITDTKEHLKFIVAETYFLMISEEVEDKSDVRLVNC